MQFARTELVRSARDIFLDAGESSDGLKSLIMKTRREHTGTSIYSYAEAQPSSFDDQRNYDIHKS